MNQLKLKIALTALGWVGIAGTSFAQTWGSWGPYDLNGNGGTNPYQNFIGTIDPTELIFKTGNEEVFRLRSDWGPYSGRPGMGGIEFNSMYNPGSYVRPSLG